MNGIRKNQKGFTLIEILVVIVIIGILFSVLLPRIDFVSGKARESGVKNNFHSFQASAESYLREIAGVSPSENGLNSFLDGATQFNSGASKLKDPWGNTYKMFSTNISNAESLIVFRSSGADTSSTSTNVLHYEGITSDIDDKVLAVYYKNGIVKSCTKGFSTDIGSMNISGAGAVVPTVDFDVPQGMRQGFQSTYTYEYAITAQIYDIVNYDGHKKVRTYVYSNSPLNLQVVNYGNTDSFIKDATNISFVGFNMWGLEEDHDMGGWGTSNENWILPNPVAFYSLSGNPWRPLSFFEQEYINGGRSSIMDISLVTGGTTQPYTILGCN